LQTAVFVQPHLPRKFGGYAELLRIFTKRGVDFVEQSAARRLSDGAKFADAVMDPGRRGAVLLDVFVLQPQQEILFAPARLQQTDPQAVQFIDPGVFDFEIAVSGVKR
jgi:hypothetical protein